MNARLEARRANSEAKCASCGWWRGGVETAARCERHDIKTLDLAVCADWRDGDVVAEVLKPEEPLPEGTPQWRREE